MASKALSYGAVAVGGLFLYSGIKGYSVITALQNIVRGKSPNTGQSVSLFSNSTPGSSGGSGAGGTNAASFPTTASETSMIDSILKGVGAPTTQANIDSLSAWIQHETPWPPVASNNPMNTTLKAAGSTQYNSVGVQNYPTPEEGAQANAQTLLGGYPNIVAALRSGKGLCGNPNLSAEFLKWSGGGYSSVC